ncbi:MAG: hypothetical protein OEV42_07685 [Deltaproteobacteria bacterium]|nr:hypothetical protein [Deltaproteobacteria bacterium]
MKNVRAILTQSLELASANKPREALSIIDKGIDTALRESDTHCIASLSKQAGVISYSGIGDIGKAKEYYELALEYNFEPDPYLHLALGDICTDLNESALAKQHYKTGYELAKKANDADLMELLSKN